MSDFDLLKTLQCELISTLEQRKAGRGWLPKSCCRTKIHRLRLQIQEVMLRIERKCELLFRDDDDEEGWE